MPPALIGFAALVIYSVYSLSRHRQLLTAGYDLGIFDQVVRQYAAFNAPYAALKGEHYNILGDHFHPILVLLAPLYWIWNDPRMLLIAQAGLIAASCPVVYAFAQRRMPAWAATLLTFGYVFGQPVQAMANFDFHEVAFAVPILAFIVNALDRQRDRELLIWCLLLLLVREDMGAVVAMVGVVRLCNADKRYRGLAFLGLGVAALGLITGVLIPHFSASGDFAYWEYDALGDDLPSVLRFIFTKPLSALQLLFVPEAKLLTWAWLYLPLLALPLVSRYNLLVLPLLVSRFWASRANLWQPDFHYGAPVWVVLCMAAAHVLGRWQNDLAELVKKLLAVLVAGLALVGTLNNHDLFPLHRMRDSAWEMTPQMKAQREILAAIPAQTCVALDDRLAPQLTATHRVSLPGIAQPSPQYVALDMSQDVVSFRLESPAYYQRQYLDQGYREIARNGAMLLLQAPDELLNPGQDCRPTAP